MRFGRFADLPLFWKLLIPSAVLITLVGGTGMTLIARSLSDQRQAELESELRRDALSARRTIEAAELSLLEATNLAVNFEGMPEAVASGDVETVVSRLQAVAAIKTDITTMAVTANGQWSVQVDAGRMVDVDRGLVDHDLVARAATIGPTARLGGLVDASRAPMLVVAAPICDAAVSCVGTAVLGIDLDQILAEATVATVGSHSDGGVAAYGPDGRRLGAVGQVPPDPDAFVDPAGAFQRVRDTLSSGPAETVYADLLVQDRAVGVLGVTVADPDRLVGTDGLQIRLVGLLAAALVGIVVVGGAVTRLVTRDVATVIDTNAEIARGNLSARAPVRGRDEVGELAEGLNSMADELQAAYENLELRVEARTAEVERLLRQRTQFFASLSHELRTPLAIILSEAELLDGASPGEAAETGSVISSSARTLLGAVNEILDVARAEAGDLVLAIEVLPAAEIVEARRSQFAALAREASVALDIDTRGGDRPVAVDRTRFENCVVNLVDNAVKYTPPAGAVTITIGGDERHVEFRVADTGLGIPADVGDDVFQPFFRVQQNRPLHGKTSSGLGLALTRSIVEAHGGTIDHRPGGDGGTEFTIRIPVAPEERSVSDVPTSTGRPHHG